METVDNLIIGAGIYGLYAALELAKKDLKVVLVECENNACTRATYINQARVHLGYHYPRSYSTATKSAGYFDRFIKDFSFAINKSYKKIYAIAKKYSYTNKDQFALFCKRANIPCREIDVKENFNDRMIEAAFETKEYSFDAKKIRDSFLDQLKKYKNVEIFYNTKINKVDIKGDNYLLRLSNNKDILTRSVLNATYASINQVIEQFGFDKLKIKYEICEVIICDVSKELKGSGLTVMDGPFFSVMPFGADNSLYSLTSVTFTPHFTCKSDLPIFPCQKNNPKCTPNSLGNCNHCLAQPKSAWTSMSQLAKKYLRDDTKISFMESLFAIKPILMASELDDSRPTVVKEFRKSPQFVSVLSGKINTIYDLKEFLDEQ